jgi:hypothetical protein
VFLFKVFHTEQFPGSGNAHGSTIRRIFTETLVVVLISSLIFLLYLMKPGVIQASDSTWAPYVVASLIYDGDLYLDEYLPWLEDMDFFGVIEVGGRYLPYFPAGGQILAIPQMLILDAVLPELRTTSLHDYLIANPPHHSFVLKLQLINASLIVALSAGVMYLIGREFLRIPYSILLAITYAFATSAYSTASRAMWQHGPSMLLLAIALLLLVKARQRPQIVVLVALPLMAAYMVRPTNGISLVFLSLYILIRYRRYFLPYLMLAVLLVVPFVISNLSVFGKLLPPYYAASRLGSPTIGEALAGTLISPSRGLFIFSPILLYAIAGIYLKHHKDGFDLLDGALIVILVAQWFVIATFDHWWGGHSFGPRFFADVMPFLIYFLIPGLLSIQSNEGSLQTRTGLAGVYALLLLVSVLIQYRGATSIAAYNWNSVPENVDRNPRRIWDWTDPQFLRGLGPDLLATSPRQIIANTAGHNDIYPSSIQIGSKTDGPILVTLRLPNRITLTEQSGELFRLDHLPNGSTNARLREPVIDQLGMIPYGIYLDTSGSGESESLGAIEVIARKLKPDQTYQEDSTIIPLATGPVSIEGSIRPSDIVVECPTHPLDELFALHGAGWYAEERDGDQSWRWAASPAYLYIWSDSAQTISMEIKISSIIDDLLRESPGHGSALLILLPDGTQLTRSLQSGQANQFEVPLQDGWNQLILESSAGNIRPADLKPGYSDLRNLSFSVDWIKLSGSCMPAND